MIHRLEEASHRCPAYWLVSWCTYPRSETFLHQQVGKVVVNGKPINRVSTPYYTLDPIEFT